MPDKRSAMTTLKVSRRIMRHVEGNARPDESVDETLRRLLGIGGPPSPKAKGPSSIIKVSRAVLRHIVRSARDRELRNQTLSRLLGIPNDDGNVKEAGAP